MLKITEVEIHHAAEDTDGNVTHVILLATLNDGQQRLLEVALPDPEKLLEVAL